MHNYWWYWHFDDRTEIWFWLNLFRIIEHYYPKYTKLDKLYFQIIFPTYISNFKRIYTAILVGQIWWLKIGDGFWMSGTVIYVKDWGYCREKGSKSSLSSQPCHQHISSPRFVTDIHLAKNWLYWFWWSTV